MASIMIDDVLFDRVALGGVGEEQSTVLQYPVADPNSGAGHPFYVTGRVNADAVGANATMRLDLEHSDDGSSWSVLETGTTHAVGVLVKTFYAMTLLVPNVHKAYIRVNKVVAGGSGFSAGTIFVARTFNRPTDHTTNPAGAATS